MPSRLIEVKNGRATVSDAVKHFASALSPLGLAAHALTTVGVCTTELAQLHIEKKRLLVQREVALAVVQGYEGMLVDLFNQAKADTQISQVSTQAIIASIGIVGEAARDMRLPTDERQVAMSTMTVFTGQLLVNNQSNRDSWVKLGQVVNFRLAEGSISALRELR
ncbi:hypothetical protein [Umezawaea sp. Da 62-37]|uniref:hypothetical protein n=1 Tax=Umezawaea sp. Da 62-37 TaxID=3075927 RepID=UPI0028F6DCEA|nr:hypothetical protein [Umezawaea sp. Da 62-37]WNV83460.1 hypothetical protein RM788_35515 [Umezawaea sp. Da 62-37]